MNQASLKAVGAAVLFSTFGCGSKPGEKGTPTGATCPTTQTLTYENFAKPFMEKYCLRCHSTSVTGAARNGAPDDHNFDEVEDIRPLAEHIDEKAAASATVTNSIMPEGEPTPTIEERRKLAEWLACSAP